MESYNINRVRKKVKKNAMRRIKEEGQNLTSKKMKKNRTLTKKTKQNRMEFKNKIKLAQNIQATNPDISWKNALKIAFNK